MTQMCGASVTSPHPAQTTCAFPESSDSSLLITPTSAWEKLKPRSVGCPAVSSISGSSVSGYYFIPGVAFVPACHPFLDCSGLGFVLRIFPPLMNLQSALPLSYSYGTYTDLSLTAAHSFPESVISALFLWYAALSCAPHIPKPKPCFVLARLAHAIPCSMWKITLIISNVGNISILVILIQKAKIL